jgi:16S rRNA pseudouridine516 synthase|tara:strand:+ start:789 stop:1487 length:699 start_codon:yes stop_codon:yes gene_type:complete
MSGKKHRLDRFISAKTGTPKSKVRLMLAQKRIYVDGQLATDINQPIDQFSHVALDGAVVQNNTRRYIMMNKPIGVVSATKDEQHKTVMDLLVEKNINTDDLHVVGRLDLNSSGLLLLTNDGDWSRALMSPEKKVAKVYEVTLENPITDECIQAFANGMYFSYEDITTKPAQLEKLSECVAKVTLEEGRYHQIKRMFGRFRNPVLALHRVSIGEIKLDTDLAPGECRSIMPRR